MTTLPVPFITTWSTEQALPTRVIHSRAGIAYADEILSDRDENGVLWTRTPSRPGHGRPQFGQVHSLRQRRAMRGLLCQVCAGPADRTDSGVLWMLKDHRGDWPRWPEHMAATDPPVCQPCVQIARLACPALRKGYVTVRVGHCPVSGIYGVRYQSGRLFPEPAEDVTVAFEDPAARWTRAAQLVRELRDCTIVNLKTVDGVLSVELGCLSVELACLSVELAGWVVSVLGGVRGCCHSARQEMRGDGVETESRANLCLWSRRIRGGPG